MDREELVEERRRVGVVDAAGHVPARFGKTVGDTGRDRIGHGESEDRPLRLQLSEGDQSRGTDDGERVVVGAREVTVQAGEQGLIAVRVLKLEGDVNRRHALGDGVLERADDLIECADLGDLDDADRDRIRTVRILELEAPTTAAMPINVAATATARVGARRRRPVNRRSDALAPRIERGWSMDAP